MERALIGIQIESAEDGKRVTEVFLGWHVIENMDLLHRWASMIGPEHRKAVAASVADDGDVPEHEKIRTLNLVGQHAQAAESFGAHLGSLDPVEAAMAATAAVEGFEQIGQAERADALLQQYCALYPEKEWHSQIGRAHV